MNELKHFLQDAASDPKIASAVHTTSATLAIGLTADVIQGWAAILATLTSVVGGLYVIQVNRMKYKHLKRLWEAGETPQKGDL